MSVLESIIEGVKLDEASRRIPDSELSERLATAAPPLDAQAALSGKDFSLIAEIKRSSPSKGALAEIPEPEVLAKSYQENGASVVSVLTEERRFNGSLSDFTSVRAALTIPMLRKDFMVSEFLIKESRAFGADMILLIVAALDDYQLRDFYHLATELGMSALIEIHDDNELERALAIAPSIIGVNARNLKTLDVDLGAFERLIPLIPSEIVKVAESGISTIEDIKSVRSLGAQAALVGEALVRAVNPGRQLAEFLASTESI